MPSLRLSSHDNVAMSTDRDDVTAEQLAQLLVPLPAPKSFLQLWLAGVPHAGGLRDLALAEIAAATRSAS